MALQAAYPVRRIALRLVEGIDQTLLVIILSISMLGLAALYSASYENPQRVIAQLAAGIQVVALTDHNTNGDLDADIAALGAEDRIASIAGN